MTTLQPLGLEEADVALDPHWLAPEEADALLAALREGVPWEIHRLRLFGREHASPRLSCWIGDPDAVYRYSGSVFVPHAWPAPLAALRARLERALGTPFNSVLANRYRDGRDAMGWHSDDEPELGPTPVIASVSLGGVRRFLLRHRTQRERRHAFELPHGSLLVMRGSTQRHWQHALPRTARVVAERVNLTFRWVEQGMRRGLGS